MDTGTRSFQVVRVSDGALSCETPEAAAAYGRYCSTRVFSELTFVAGEKATVYWGRPLTVSERRNVANKTTDRDRYEAAFVTGLVKVDDLEYPDGTRREWLRPTDHSGKERPVPDDALDRFFDEATVQEIGMVIMQRSFLGRSPGHWYPLPGICQDALRARLLLRAVLTPASSPSPDSSPPVEAQPPTLPRSSPGGVDSTGATAMESAIRQSLSTTAASTTTASEGT